MLDQKYHIVKSSDFHKIAQYIYPCPIEFRAEGRAIREIRGANLFVSNFKGSEHLMEKFKGKITWTTLPDGTEVGMIQGVEIMI